MVCLGGDSLDEVYDLGGPFHDVDQIITKGVIIELQQSLETLLEVLLQRFDEVTDGFPQEVFCAFVLVVGWDFPLDTRRSGRHDTSPIALDSIEIETVSWVGESVFYELDPPVQRDLGFFELFNPVDEVEGVLLEIRLGKAHGAGFEVLVLFLRKIVCVHTTTDTVRPFEHADTVSMYLE